MDLWGMGTRSLPYTIWQLFARPGYLIGDYISGRRQISFPPVKMLVIVALVTYLVSSLWGVDIMGGDEGMVGLSDDERSLLNSFSRWLSKHYDWASLFIFMMMVLPTYIVFRYAPRNPHHTLPQGFFIQVFNSTQFLCLMVLWSIIIKQTGFYYDITTTATLFVIPVLLFYNYKQLFGYGFWGTLWRMSVCWLLWVLTVLIVNIIDSIIIDIRYHTGLQESAVDIHALSTCVILFAYVAFYTNIINMSGKRGKRQQEGKGIKRLFAITVTAIIHTTMALVFIRSIFTTIARNDTTYCKVAAITLVIFAITGYYLFSTYRKWKKTNNEKPSEQEGGSD